MLEMPRPLRATIVSVHGARGERWLAGLSDLLADIRARWQIEVFEPLADLSFNLLCVAQGRDGRPLILKLGVPCVERSGEIGALRLYGGSGTVRVVRANRRAGALLLERVVPGTPLAAIGDDDEAVHVFSGVYRELRRPMPRNGRFRTLADWMRGFDRLERQRQFAALLPEGLVRRAHALAGELGATREGPSLLHGDLHDGNILLGPSGWIAIDPKGIVGDPCYDTATFLVNRIGAPAAADLRLLRRSAILETELGLPRRRMLAWAFVHAVLSAFWHLEDGTEGAAQAIEVARILSHLLDRL